MAGAEPKKYHQRHPEKTVLYRVIQQHLEGFLEHAHESSGKRLPKYVESEFRRYLECGVHAHGFARAVCETCGDELLLPFSCELSPALFQAFASGSKVDKTVSEWCGLLDDATHVVGAALVGGRLWPRVHRRRHARPRRERLDLPRELDRRHQSGARHLSREWLWADRIV